MLMLIVDFIFCNVIFFKINEKKQNIFIILQDIFKYTLMVIFFSQPHNKH